MLKRLFFIGCIICLFVSCEEGPAYEVKLRFSDLKPQDIYAVFEAADSKSVDTLSYDGLKDLIIRRQDGDFRTLTIYFENRTQWISVYLEPHKKVSVTGEALYPQLLQIKGGKINDRLTAFRKEVSPLLKEQVLLLNGINASPNGAGEKNVRLANLYHEICSRAERFIKKNPEDEASAILIRDFFFSPDNPLQTEELLNTLSPKLDDFYVVKDLKTFCEKSKRTMAGAQAPDFNIRNVYGTPYNISSFNNRYFVLAFVATWCDKCQTDELFLDKIISSFPDDQLDVMLVSLDENPREVRDLIHNDSIRWNVVTDSAGQAISLLDLYNVKALPLCFLIDKDGKIILKTENGVELEKVLEEFIEKKKGS
ncbi:MAG: TlpA family protein disulfide reductase [Tannerella sp.]|jgi:peroxiredoxin|nr:TlpA family protein disulfide reductase [Tannerella sp.]